jgi:hypothetical protein
VRRIAGVRLQEHGSGPLRYVDAGEFDLAPGARVEVEITGERWIGIVIIAPEQVVLCQVAPVGRVLEVVAEGPSVEGEVTDAGVTERSAREGRTVTVIEPAGVCQRPSTSSMDAVMAILPGAGLPYLGERVETEVGDGEVIKLDVPKRCVTVQLDQGEVVTLSSDAVQRRVSNF